MSSTPAAEQAHEFVASRALADTCIQFVVDPKTGIGSVCCRPRGDAVHPAKAIEIEIDDYVGKDGERI